MVKEKVGLLTQEIILEGIDSNNVFEIREVDVKRQKIKLIVPSGHVVYINYVNEELTSQHSKRVLDASSFNIAKGGKVSIIITKEEQEEIPLSFMIDNYILRRSGTNHVKTKYALIGHVNFMINSVLDAARKYGKTMSLEDFKKDMNQMRLSELSSQFKKQISQHYSADMTFEDFKAMVYSVEIDCYEINKTSACKSRGVKLKEKNISYSFNDIEGEDFEDEIKGLTKEQFEAEKSGYTKIINENTAKPQPEEKPKVKEVEKEKKEEKWTCSRCGEENSMKSRYCHKCGNKRN